MRLVLTLGLVWGVGCAASPRIGVVDVRACFDSRRNAMVKEADAKLEQKLREHQAVLKSLDPGLHEEARKKFRVDYMQFFERQTVAVLERIVKHTSDIARERGLQLVCRTTDPPSGDAEPERDPILRNVVLYHDPAVDLTEEVLRRFNAPAGPPH